MTFRNTVKRLTLPSSTLCPTMTPPTQASTLSTIRLATPTVLPLDLKSQPRPSTGRLSHQGDTITGILIGLRLDHRGGVTPCPTCMAQVRIRPAV
jgi:hypothetical protein